MKIPLYQQFLRESKCRLCSFTGCDPHHIRHGTARRNHDQDCISLCRLCHQAIHDGQITVCDDALKRLAKEQFNAWLLTLQKDKREKIECKLKEDK